MTKDKRESIEISGPDSTFAIHAKLSDKALHKILTAYPESAAVYADNGEEVVVLCREYSVVTELIDLHKNGEIDSFEIK